MKDGGVTPCRVCSTPLRVPLWLTPFSRWMACSSREACTFRLEAQRREPPGPIDYEPEPDDIWVCSRCHGHEEHPVALDWETNALRIIKCELCQGTGVQPGYTGRLVS